MASATSSDPRRAGRRSAPLRQRSWPGLVLGLLLAGTSWASEQVYLSAEQFLAQAFPAQQPQAGVVWLTADLRAQVQELVGEDYGAMRIRYWAHTDQTAWILDMIGKEKPITVGVLVASGQISRLDVLVFRESRGWEVHDQAFTRQFGQAELTDDQQLSQHIDGITGATLSVRALKKMARLALFLHQQVQRKPDHNE